MAEEGDQQIQYVIVQSDDQQADEEVQGIDQSIADALARHAAETGTQPGQQFQIVKEDSDGNATTTIVVVDDSGYEKSIQVVEKENDIGDLIALAMGSSGVDGAQINTNTAPTYVVQEDGSGNQELVVGGNIQSGDYQLIEGEDFGPDTQVVFVRSEEEAAEAARLQETETDQAAKALLKDLSEVDQETEESAESFLRGSKRRRIEKKIYREDLNFIRNQNIYLHRMRDLEMKIIKEDGIAASRQQEIDHMRLQTLDIRKKIKLVDAAIEKSKGWKDIESKISLPAS